MKRSRNPHKHVLAALWRNQNPDGVSHSCVWSEGKIWDPNPLRRGLVIAENVDVFCALRPEAIARANLEQAGRAVA